MNEVGGEIPFSLADEGAMNYFWLTLTNQCNIHCKYCFNYIHSHHESLSPEKVVRIIKTHLQLKEGVNGSPLRILYFGGEPTLNQEALFAAVDFLVENEIECQQYLLTNGLFNQKVFSNLVGKNINFQISYDGPMADLRLTKCQKSSASDKTVSMIKKLTSYGENVLIRATIHQGNVQSIPDLVRFCEKNQVSKLMCAPICEFGESKNNGIKQPVVAEYIAVMQEALELANTLGVNLEVQGEEQFRTFLKRKLPVPLVWLPDGKAAMTITYSSSKVPGAESIIIGELDEYNDTLRLEKKKISQMKKNFIKNRETYCSSCSIKTLCQGNNLFTAFATDTVNFERDNYFCELARESVKAFPDVSDSEC